MFIICDFTLNRYVFSCSLDLPFSLMKLNLDIPMSSNHIVFPSHEDWLFYLQTFYTLIKEYRILKHLILVYAAFQMYIYYDLPIKKWLTIYYAYSKFCLKMPLSKEQKIGSQD